MSGVDEAVAALAAGQPVVLPFDTVYGLAADPYRSEPAERLYRLKQRPQTQPSALVATDLDHLFECLPELRGRSATIARALLPGPLTLIFPNPARRFRWITGANQDAIGVRVPHLTGPGAEVLARAGCVVATSASRPGRPTSRRGRRSSRRSAGSPAFPGAERDRSRQPASASMSPRERGRRRARRC